MHPFTSYYATILIITGFVAFFGWQALFRLIAYVELLLKYQWIQFQMFLMRKKLERQLGFPARKWSKEDVI